MAHTHLVFVCKYRKSLLKGKLGDDIKGLIYEIAEEKDFGIVEMEVEKNHIHILINYNPTQSILLIVRLLKQMTTYRIWRTKQAIYLEKNYWK